ncbi:MAG: NHL repeat-containing protein [Treponemataceae bacterium]
MKKNAVLFSLSFALLSFFVANAQQKTVDRAAVLAAEEFRRGVQSYNRYAFNESILSLEKALSYKPAEALILDWLGRAYYRSGLEDTALRQWQAAFSAYAPSSSEGLLLNGRMETVRNRRSLYPELDENARYVDAGKFPSMNGDIVIYKQPTAVLPNPDGSVWVVAYGSNELIRIDANGIVRKRVRGPLNGFDRPYDIARAIDGRLYVSEFKGNRISVLTADGDWKSYIGTKGRGDGQFIGPQNMTVDSAGYLYVTDFGNRRVVKFSPEGKFVLAFGTKGGLFTGFIAPTGIAAVADEMFVADSGARRLVRFDRSGNFLGYFSEGALSHPESIRLSDDGKLIVADSGRVLLIDTKSGLVRDLGKLGAKSRIVSAAADANGNIVAADFAAGEITLMTRMDDLSAGLFVQIERVYADKFPEISVEISVQDRRRRPLVGLGAGNFVLNEGGRQVSKQTFLGSAYAIKQADVAFLVERSPETSSRTVDIAQAVRDVQKSETRITALVSAAEQPIKERIDNAAALENSSRAKVSDYSRKWKFDLGLRLAATELLSGEKKRAVVFVTSGRLGEKAFERYGLSELAAYLANNGIVFYAALLNDAPPDREISYLCAQTGGKAMYVFRPEGIAPLISALRDAPNGVYSLRYTSSLPTDFGRSYLPVEVEAYFLVRSGRDATGYFPPLK